jgi:hypothetical protein
LILRRLVGGREREIELKETMEAAKGLNAEKNGVKISDVLDSVLQTQVADLTKSIEHKNPVEFQKSLR